jgi:DnaK suppressor protein
MVEPMSVRTANSRRSASYWIAGSVLLPDQLRQIQQLLQEREVALRLKIRETIARQIGPARLDLDAMGTASDASDAMGASVARLLQDFDPRLLAPYADELLELETARESLKEDGYGDCVVCHGAIGFERLLAMPTARLCLACQERRERLDWR